MRSIRLLVLVITACGGASTSAPRASTVSASVVSEGDVPDELFTGQLSYEGGERERRQIERGIDAATEEMNFIARGIARGRLKDTNRAPESIALSREGNRLTVVIDGRRYEGTLDGPPVTVTGITGDEVEMTYRIEGAHLVQAFRGEDGGRENAFELVEANTVVLDVRVFSPRLPADVLYSLTYRRLPSPRNTP